MRRSRRWFGALLLVSTLLHLLFLLLQDWVAQRGGAEIRFAVQLPPPPPSFSAQAPAPARSLAGGGALEQAGPEGGTAEWQGEAGAGEGPSLEPGIGLSQGMGRPGGGVGEKGAVFVTARDTLPSLREMDAHGLRRYLEARERYARLELLDADTTDEASRRRRQAQEVVLQAVEAMGGAGALAQLRNLQDQEGYHQSYGMRSKYARGLIGGARLVYDGEQAWIEVHGKARPLKGWGMREVERRAERWDFLSRYLGEGIRLTYLGPWEDAGGRNLHALEVEDRKYGTPPFRALFDQASHLLVTEEGVVNGAVVPVKRFLDYRAEGRAWIWHQVAETQRHTNTTRKYRGSSYSISYAEIDDRVFALAAPDTGWGRLQTFESQATLWVEVQVANGQVAAFPGWTGGTNKLGEFQKQMVAQQLEVFAVDDLSRRGLVPRVERLDRTAAEQPKPGDFVLEIVLGSPTYQAALYEAGSRQQLMQDGPPGNGYLDTHPECGKYSLEIFTAEDDIAWVSEESVMNARSQGPARLLLNTYDKVAQAIKLYEHGEREHFPFVRECCYCQ